MDCQPTSWAPSNYGVLKQLDARRRAFLWTGTDTASGAQCLAAWETACKRKEGGLGIPQLQVQNSCLLLKLIHRLHHPNGSAWAAWARERVHLHSLQGAVEGSHWQALRDLLPAYRCITRVQLGNGHTTDFWEDIWEGEV